MLHVLQYFKHAKFIMNHGGTAATTNQKRTLLGNIEASGTMFVKLNFSQLKRGESTKKRKRPSADRQKEENSEIEK